MTIDAPFKIVRSLDMTIEVDQFIVDNGPEPHLCESQRELRSVLEQFTTSYPNKEHDAQGNVSRVHDDLHSLSAKAPGMLSFGFGPTKDVGEIRIELESFQRELSHVLEEAGMRSFVVGSVAAIDEASSLHAETGLSFERADGALPAGAASLAYAVAPLLALLCDNSPATAAGGHIMQARKLHDAGCAIEHDGQHITLHVADALPAPFATAYVTLVKGIFATDEGMASARGLLGNPDQPAIELAWKSIGSDGFDAIVYGKPAHELAGALIECACTTLASNEHNYLSPLRQLARMRKTLSMMGRR